LASSSKCCTAQAINTERKRKKEKKKKGQKNRRQIIHLCRSIGGSALITYQTQLRWQATEMLLSARKAIEKKKLEENFDKCIKREAEKRCNRTRDYII
jgi:hypothetical protein